MKNKLILKPNTIVMTIGISNCGKSYFCENHLIPFLNSHKISNKYLSSDGIRRMLLNDDSMHKHAPEMMYMSKQAFSILHNQLDNYTQYPVNTSVVIVDATNISTQSRKDIFDIAKKNHYNVVGLVFDYANSKDYFKHCDANTKKFVIKEHLAHFKEKTLPFLEHKEFKKVYKITNLDFDTFDFVYEEVNIEKFDTSKYERYCIITDPHGCFDEVLECVLDNKGLSYNAVTGLLEITNPLNYHHHIINGDYLDKGPQIKQLIKFLYDNRQFFTIVKGNHENFVYKYLKGELGSYEKQKDLIDNYFDSCLLLEKDEEYKQMFFELFENSYNYIKGSNFIVTHAPCRVKYLGKDDNESIKNQRTIVYPKRKDYASEEEFLDAFESFFSFINDEAGFNQPFHFFGHVALKEQYTIKNKYALDAGCVYGNKLTVAQINSESKKPFIKHYRSKQDASSSKALYPMFRVKINASPISNYDIDLQRRIKWGALNKVNFISGTMSPVDKEGDDIESLKQGLLYYSKNGVNKVILQPKFMGSRGNLLLHKTDIEKCKVFSRQAFTINNERLFLSTDKNLFDVYKEMQIKYTALFEKHCAEYILFDGELLPWKSVGKGLIEKDFLVPMKALESELHLLKESGFDTMLNDFSSRMKQLDENSPIHLQRQKNLWDEFKKEVQSSDVLNEDLQKYSRQMEVFAGDGELEYKPFSILKVVKTDGTEENFISSTKSNIEIFDSISNESYAIVDFKTSTISISQDGMITDYFATDFDDLVSMIIKQYWEPITKVKEMEGVVIKPDIVYTPGLAPYLKCRNKEYLRIIYGMDYQSLPIKTNKLIRNKSIKRKLETSIKEWELGKKMLDVPMKDISMENNQWVSLYVLLVMEQESETELDPRL